MIRGTSARTIAPAKRRGWRKTRPVLRGRPRPARSWWWPVLLLLAAASLLVWKFSHHPSVQKMRYPLLYPELVTREAQRAGIAPSLVAAVILHESEFRRSAVSPVGAQGLMQLMPETAAWVDQHLEGHGQRSLDLFSPELNVRLGAVYLSYLWERFKGDEVACLAAYNAGPELAAEWSRATPDGFLREGDIEFAETRQYVRAVLSSESHYRALYPELRPLSR